MGVSRSTRQIRHQVKLRVDQQELRKASESEKSLDCIGVISYSIRLICQCLRLIRPQRKRMTSEEKQGLLIKCGDVFRPAGPINKIDLFAGRLQEIKKIINAVNTQSRHAI